MATDGEILDLFARAGADFVAAVREVAPERFSAATPCSDWDVHTLVNHVVAEDRWVAPLVAGRTIADVGSELDGDLLGGDPAAAAAGAAAAALTALSAPGALSAPVQLSFGEFTAEAYAWQVLADHLIHTWDVLVAVGADPALPVELVTSVAGWWSAWEDGYRAAGAIAAAVEVGPGANAQDRLIGSFGRNPGWTA